ncbi:uncharacterized protein LOC118432926 [Folsomia candida]|uniref:uncharacterized protein LOC118432926 n=1 Tax=Folsomia candida TaxID=158441 RepID=UPI001604AC3B|nr:uncharacterized protein LOC118432926 [Folsomia candida]
MSSKSGNQPPNVTNSVVRSTASSDSFSDDNNLNKQARIELIGLQRRYRVLEDQRHGFTQEGGCTARKQLWMVQLLKDEKEDIISNLRNANCSLYKRKAKKAEATILEFIKRYETYKIHIEDHLRNIKELSDEGDKIQAQVVHQKLKILTLYGQQISRSGSERRIKIRENKLYHITSKFDEQCKGNEYLREQISFFLRARTAFHKRHNYLKREIANEKNKMLQLVTHAEFTYDNRDEAVAKIKILRERDSKESKQHVTEVKEFQRVLHHDRKVHNFLHDKNQGRAVIEEDDERRCEIF